MSQSENHKFVRVFGGIIVALVLLTVVLIFVARSLQLEPDMDANPSQRVLAEQRIKPIASVRVGAEGAAALAEVHEANAPAPADGVAAEVDGKQVYNGLCATCHESGLAGAPMAGSDQMALLLGEKGLDTMVMNAINGINIMPPRGGNPGLTDEQIRAAIEFMLP
jgi:cytochrome c5